MSANRQSAAPATAESGNRVTYPTPSTMDKALKLSLKLTKPIDLYFYLDSLRGRVCIMNDGEDMVIYKNDEEMTSPILKTYQSDNQYITVTENSIYILDASTPIKSVGDADA
jgi:hypothetical protein